MIAEIIGMWKNRGICGFNFSCTCVFNFLVLYRNHFLIYLPQMERGKEKGKIAFGKWGKSLVLLYPVCSYFMKALRGFQIVLKHTGVCIHWDLFWCVEMMVGVVGWFTYQFTRYSHEISLSDEKKFLSKEEDFDFQQRPVAAPCGQWASWPHLPNP